MSIQYIPLSQLKASRHNVRKTGGRAVDDLAASIQAVGLLQNLVVNKGDGCYYVCAGGRRLAALQQIQRAGGITADYPVPCQVIEVDETDIIEASLAENTIREAMHPADQFDAFQEIYCDGLGLPIADIAARFGVSENVVRQRLKLAKLSPRLVAEYREGKATLDQMQALAICDDHAAQEKAWGENDGWHRNPHQLSKALTEFEISSTDARVKFVGLEAYEAAGGTVRRDLFGDSAYVADTELLSRLVAEKLAETTEALKADGWQWVDTFINPDYEERSGYKLGYRAESRAYTTEEQAEIDRLEARQEEIRPLLEDAEGDEYAALNDEDDAITEKIDELEEAALVWSDEAKAASGVL